MSPSPHSPSPVAEVSQLVAEVDVAAETVAGSPEDVVPEVDPEVTGSVDAPPWVAEADSDVLAEPVPSVALATTSAGPW